MADQPRTTNNGGGQVVPHTEPDDILPAVNSASDLNISSSVNPLNDTSGSLPTQNIGGSQATSNIQSVSSGGGQASMPDVAENNDLIEKEWVNKAKEIVEKTAEDPFIQQQEIGKIRLDYQKKRYNKDINAG